MSSRGSRHIAARLIELLPSVICLAFSVFAMSALLRDFPGLNREARVEGLFGDWRVPVAAALYNRSDYLFQIGFGYLQGDVVASAATEPRDEIATIKTARLRAEVARNALEESSRLAPGNAYTWSFLGWARALDADIPGAIDALEISWALAPNNSQLAPVRINLAEILIEIDESAFGRPEFADGASRDLSTLNTYDRRYLSVALEDAPQLKKLARSAGIGIED